MVSSLVLIANLAALLSVASARPAASPVAAAHRARSTPSSAPPTAGPLLAEDETALLIAAMAAAAAPPAANRVRALDYQLSPDLTLEKRAANASSCLDSSANDVTINSLFYYGGAGTVVSLCPGATIQLSNSIFFTDANQELSTQGYPTDSTRATLVVTGAQQSNAVYGTCDKCQNAALKNVQVYGARDKLGYMKDGLALVEMGGNTAGQLIDSCHIWEPRGWSALHGIEGANEFCNHMTITNNQIGPSGNSPTTGTQFSRRQSVAPNQWADGISMACHDSEVSSNVITDATDGGIVVFGAPNTHVHDNTIVSKTRVLMGGINMVDFAPYNGDYTGTVVENNHIISDTDMIKVGIALGGMTWGSDNRTASRTYAGVVKNNVLTSGSSGYFGYGITIAGHNNATVIGNDLSLANFGGGPSTSCIPQPAVPSPQALVYDQWTSPGSVMQNNFVDFSLVFLICQQPGSILAKGPVTPLTNQLIGDLSNLASSVVASSTVASTSTAAAAATTASSPAAAVPVSTSSPMPAVTSTQAFAAPAATTTSAPTTTTTASPEIVSSANLARLNAIASRKSQMAALRSASILAAASQAAHIASIAEVRAERIASARSAAKNAASRHTRRDSSPYARQTPAAPKGMFNPFIGVEQQS